MNFNDMIYRRPDTESMIQSIRDRIQELIQEEEFENQDRIFNEINGIRNTFDTMESICLIRHSINTNDEFYKSENDYFDLVGPKFTGIVTEFYRAVLLSKSLDQFKKKHGQHWFNLAQTSLKVFSEDIIPEMQKENQLITEYNQLIAAAKIDFDGKEYTLAEMGPLLMDSDRDIRKRSHEQYFGYLSNHQKNFDRIYDELVKLRDSMAKKLGFENYIPMAYARLGRTDYNADDVSRFRQAVLKDITPISSSLMELQRERIEVDELKYYDLKYLFSSGNPKPSGNADEIIFAAGDMYRELAPETNEFFAMMMDNQLMDLVAKKGKEAGGYCTFIHDYQSPFVFSNFNGTYGDVTVLTHEFGHAYQVYCGRAHQEPEYIWPTLEAAEIASMGMEAITWPWMDKFFGNEADKFRFMHLQENINFIPYGVSVDEFQHVIYQNPEMTPDERLLQWREIEKKYMPYKDYSGNQYLESGGYWQKQGHIFSVPFYYIDYTLAQMAAFEILIKAQENPQGLWKDYQRICDVAGSQSYTKILKEGNLRNPFKLNAISSIMDQIGKLVATFDVEQF
jgi:M3 family oligoendopeptidase